MCVRPSIKTASCCFDLLLLHQLLTSLLLRTRSSPHHHSEQLTRHVFRICVPLLDHFDGPGFSVLGLVKDPTQERRDSVAASQRQSQGEPVRLVALFTELNLTVGFSPSQSRSLLAKIFNKSGSSSPARAAQTPEEIFREIMSINASSGAPQVKVSCPALAPFPFLRAHVDSMYSLGQAWMFHSEWEEKRAVPTEKTAEKKPSKSTTRALLRTSQETADEIMRLNATHGHPDVKVCALFFGHRRRRLLLTFLCSSGLSRQPQINPFPRHPKLCTTRFLLLTP